jgi:hypothetical protein
MNIFISPAFPIWTAFPGIVKRDNLAATIG